MVSESRARTTRCRPAIAKSHKAGAERAPVYSILAAARNSHDGDGDSARRRLLGDVVPVDKTQLKFHAKTHITKRSPKILTNLSPDWSWRIHILL